MIYMLFISLVIIFVLSYVFSGRDLFAPATVQILTFAGSVFMCIYFMLSMNCMHEFRWETIAIIMITMALSAIIGIVMHQVFLGLEIKAQDSKSVYISPISNVVSFLTIGIILITIIWLLTEIRRIGGVSGNFFMTMTRFHALNSYSTEEEGKIPWFLSQLISLTHVLFLLYSFNLIRFFGKLTIWMKCVNLTVLGLCCLTLLLTGSRTNVINNLIACFIMFHLLRIQKMGGYKRYRLKFLLRVAVLVLVVFAAFFMTKSFVGRASRNETMNAVDYISYYIGSGYIALDKYFHNPPMPSKIFGKETFYSLISFLINYNVINIPPYITHLEFRPVGAGFTNNVYTFIRVYHYDFGVIGMYIMHSIVMLFLSGFYEYVKRKRGNISILFFSMMYYSIVMSFFTERFFSNAISMNFIKRLIMLLTLYELFIRKRIRFVLGNRRRLTTERH